MADQRVLELAVQLQDEADPEAIDRVANVLSRELLALDVDSVERQIAEEAPPSTRGGEALAIGALLIKLAKNAVVLHAVVRAVRSRLGSRDRTATLEIDGDKIEVTGISSETQERLVAAWIDRHAGP